MRRRMLGAAAKLTSRPLHRRGLPKPTRRPGDDIIAISDSFPRAVREGLVEIHPALAAVEGDAVTFDDGTRVEVGASVHATGFDPPADFLDEDARPERRPLFRGIVHPQFPGLHFVGLIEAHRALLPIVESQAGWSADVLAGRIDPPDEPERLAIAGAEADRKRRDFGDRHPFLLDYARYMARLGRDRKRGAVIG